MLILTFVLLFSSINSHATVNCFERFEHYDQSENVYSCNVLDSYDWVETAINEICTEEKTYSVFTAKESVYSGKAQYYICCTIKDGWEFEYTSGELNSGCWKRIIRP